MMSKKQWFVLLCMYIIYLLLGASVFHEVEKREELKALIETKRDRHEIEELLVRHYVPTEEHTQNEIFDKLSDYCGKPLSADMNDLDPPLKWDFYHSLFFVITVVSTIGYGNLAPTTTLTRIFMIFYGIIGIPMNGIVIITLGDFFGKSFLKLYDRWKTLKVQHALATLGLVGQIILYLIPGFTFFIFLPSILIMIYEGWAYDVAVAYAFVTLTTIGFGDWVAGVHENGHGEFLYTAYQIFLLIWIITGLGYIVMVLGFVTRGMRSKKMHNLEHKIACNIKKTNHKIREELRSVLNEYLLMRVKRVYREKFVYVPTKCKRSRSCPDLTIYSAPYYKESPMLQRKRAFSAIGSYTPPEMSRIQSDSDLHRIDKDKTFTPSAAMVEPSHLLLRVVNALGNYENIKPINNTPTTKTNPEGINLFSSNEILASEQYNSGWSIGTEKLSKLPRRGTRPRAASECKTSSTDFNVANNSDFTWYGPDATKRLQELRAQRNKYKALYKTSVPFTPPPQPQSIFTKLMNTFKGSKENSKSKTVDIEKQDFSNEIERNRTYSANEDQVRYIRQNQDRSKSSAFLKSEKVLEETSIADFLRALTAISVPECAQPKRKLGIATLTPPESSTPRTRHLSIKPHVASRRSSLMPYLEHEYNYRRFSLRPESTISEAPPPYSASGSSNLINPNRRFSLRPVQQQSITASPVQRQTLRFKQSFPPSQETEPKNSNAKDSNA